ncbi:hypothetical protein IEQ11_15495 [Lysobacter capsici]|uniref:hypothetical protein n=1 Tax=Lysobacter capsici TaxID=435897 RepID=UPI001FF65EB4|nr:hypothetical protein [Lysobacter capsici]UOF13156.1 hypothetical protein IEQ11_15495 [Lysobacter capsici]
MNRIDTTKASTLKPVLTMHRSIPIPYAQARRQQNPERKKTIRDPQRTACRFMKFQR